jgi:hypothetical protein
MIQGIEGAIEIRMGIGITAILPQMKKTFAIPGRSTHLDIIAAQMSDLPAGAAQMARIDGNVAPLRSTTGKHGIKALVAEIAWAVTETKLAVLFCR